MEEKIFGLDIREKIFAPLLDEIQVQIIKLMDAVDKGFVSGGAITSKINITVEKEKKKIVLVAGGKEDYKEIKFSTPIIDYATALSLSRTDKGNGRIQLPEAELLHANGKYILRELEQRQLSIDDIDKIYTEQGEMLYE